MDTKTFDSLPFEIVIEIFQLLPFEDLVKSVQYVSLKWQNLARDEILWKDISFKPSLGLRSEHVVELLKQAPLLRSFEFRDGLKKDEIFNILCEHNREIVALSFHSVDANDSEIVRRMVDTFPDLEYLQIPLAVFVSNVVWLGKFRKLRKVKCIHSFNANAQFYEASPCVFEDSDWSALEELCLYSEHNDRKVEQMIVQVRGKLKTLELQALLNSSFLGHIPHFVNLENLKLNFMSRYLQSPNLTDVFGSMQTLANSLKCLSLSSFVHSDADILCRLFNKAKFLELVELNLYHTLNFSHNVSTKIVSNCPKLEIIRLNGCVVLDDASVQELSRLPNLSVLDISGCPDVSGDGLQYLPGCLNLKELNLSWNGLISLPMLEHISNVVNLKTLRLDHTELNGSHLVDVARKLKHLKLLSLYHAQGVDGEELQMMLPSCFVQHTRRDVYEILREKSRSLKTLDIHGVFRNTLKVLPECQALETLNVDFLERPCSQFPEVFDLVKRFRNLRSVSFRNFVQTERGQLLVLLGGDDLKQLQELKLENIYSVNHDLVALIASNFPKLEKLSLKGCVCLKDDCVSTIMNMKSLKSLDVTGCPDLSVDSLNQLKTCANLVDLNV